MNRFQDQIDPQDMADQLAERSERIDNALDAAFEQGQEDCFSARQFDGVEEGVVFRSYTGRAATAYREGWAESAVEMQEEIDDDSYCCSLDPSMRDTHGVGAF